jgi:hypothetical protein
MTIEITKGSENPVSEFFSSPSRTPNTDDLARGNHVVPTEWAEQLERERDEWRKKFELSVDAVEVAARLARAESERDEAREQLRKASVEANTLATPIQKTEYPDAKEFELLGSVAGVISQIDNMYAGVRQQRDEAREALDCLLAVIGLTPIAGNKKALQEAVDQCLVVLRKQEETK